MGQASTRVHLQVTECTLSLESLHQHTQKQNDTDTLKKL